MLPTAHYNMGGIPTNMHGEVISPRDGDPDAVVPGLMALGEAACVSVHGANRLGSNSLIDLVVFGRAAALRCAEMIKKDSAIPELPKGAGESAIERLDRFRYADGGTPTAELRLKMQKAMQNHCAVFRTKKVLKEGVEGHPRRVGRCRRHPRHRPLADLEHRPDRDARIRQSHLAVGRHRRKARWRARKAAGRMRARTSPSATTPSG